MYNFKINQIVKGVKAGTFVILGWRLIGDETYAQLKPVNPSDHSQVLRGEIALPADKIIPL